MSNDPNDLDRIAPGSEVYVRAYDLNNVVGIVRSVHKRDGEVFLSVRIPRSRVPKEVGDKYISDPRDPSMIPIYLRQGEWKLKSQRRIIS